MMLVKEHLCNIAQGILLKVSSTRSYAGRLDHLTGNSVDGAITARSKIREFSVGPKPWQVVANDGSICYRLSEIKGIILSTGRKGRSLYFVFAYNNGKTGFRSPNRDEGLPIAGIAFEFRDASNTCLWSASRLLTLDGNMTNDQRITEKFDINLPPAAIEAIDHINLFVNPPWTVLKCE